MVAMVKKKNFFFQRSNIGMVINADYRPRLALALAR